MLILKNIPCIESHSIINIFVGGITLFYKGSRGGSIFFDVHNLKFAVSPLLVKNDISFIQAWCKNRHGNNDMMPDLQTLNTTVLRAQPDVIVGVNAASIYPTYLSISAGCGWKLLNSKEGSPCRTLHFILFSQVRR